MFSSARSAISAYASVGMETGVMAASPHKLIVMLFDGALAAVRLAQQHMQAGTHEGKGQAVAKAILILEGGLRASLDLRSGGDVAESLDALYAYMRNRLLKASLDNDLSILEEVRRLLEELRAAWEAIGVERAAGVAGTTPALLPASLPPGLAAAAVRAYG